MKFRTRLEKTGGPSAVTIGNFDGFHLGHKAIVDMLLKTAGDRGLRSVILTFRPHPRVFLKQPVHLISTDPQRLDVLRRQRPDYLFFIDFADVIDCPADAFVEDILLGRLRMNTLIVGQDFRFGRRREGDLAGLRRLAAKNGFQVIGARTLRRGGCRVASSEIRKKLAAGAIAAANRMLGHPYTIEGIVEKGAGRGRRLGFPTINLASANAILPAGVFHTQTEINGRGLPSVTNIGSAPTFAGRATAAVRVETHIPGFRRMIYGQKVAIAFIDKIREEVRFDSGRDLAEQIRLDIASLKI
jgi:riboflavin kinase/FMN adenylyltransferase